MPFSFLFYWGAIALFMSTQQWFFMWLLMELSTIAFMGLFFAEKLKTENITLYFLIQSVASFFILFSLVNSETNMFSHALFSVLMWGGLFLKMGMAPTHLWVLTVAVQMKKFMASVMLLIQKIIPLVWMITLTSSKIIMLSLLGFMSLLWVSPQNFSQSSAKMMIILSSVSHSGWILMSCASQYLLEIYFSTYVAIMLFVMMFFYNNFKNIFEKNNRTPLFLILLMLGGLPPLMGFFPKFLILTEWMNLKILIVSMLILTLSTLDLFVYGRLGLLSTMKMKTSLKWMMESQVSKKIFLINFYALLLFVWM